MPTTQYIGSRYVPLLADPVEWSSTKEYEPLTIVTHEGNSYTSKQFVPKGIDITNEAYWALTGNYNAQVEQYRQETAQAIERVTEISTTLESNVDNKISDLTDFVNAKARITTPEEYGAKGDGISDDTQAFETMFSAINSDKKPAIIILNTGATYYIHVTAHMENILIVGNGATLDGKERTALIADSTSHDIEIENCVFNNDVNIMSIPYSCSGFSLASSDASKEYECYNVIVRNCIFNAGVFGFTADNAKNIIIDNCNFYNGYYNAPHSAGGYHILEQSCKNFKVTNCTFTSGTYARHSIYISVNQEKEDKQSRNVIIENCIFDQREMQNIGSARYSPDTRVIMIRAVENLNISNCYAYSITGFATVLSSDGTCDNIKLENITCDGLVYYSSAQAPSETRYFITATGTETHKPCIEISNVVFKNADDKANRAFSFVNVNLTIHDITITRVYLNSVHINAHDITMTEGYGFYCSGDALLTGRIYNIEGPSVALFNPDARVRLSAVGAEFFANLFFNGSGEIRYIQTKPIIPLTYQKMGNGYLQITIPNIYDNDLMLYALPRHYQFTPIISYGSWNTSTHSFTVLYKDSSNQLITTDDTHYYLSLGKL